MKKKVPSNHLSILLQVGGIKTTDGIAKGDCLNLPGQNTLYLIIAFSTRKRLKSKALSVTWAALEFGLAKDTSLC